MVLGSNTMKKIFLFCILVLLIAGFFISKVRFSEQVAYQAYSVLYEYRRLTPELFPEPFTLQVSSIGHMTTLADTSWVGLIQFIGDNVGNGKYLDFSHHILTNITSLSPYFEKAYELDLLFTPLVYAGEVDNVSEEDKSKIERAIKHGKKGMQIFCDTQKIEMISKIPFGKNLWSRDDLKNPCTRGGMIPYYIALHYANDFNEYTKAAYFYKIASMQDDAPEAAKFL
jgi:hypothetical protein